MLVQFLSGEDPLEEGMATHSSILAWRIPQKEEPGKLQSRFTKSQTGLKQLSMHTLNIVFYHFNHFFFCLKHYIVIFLQARNILYSTFHPSVRKLLFYFQ